MTVNKKSVAHFSDGLLRTTVYLSILIALLSSPLLAQQNEAASAAAETGQEGQHTIDYPAVFFSRYNPATALDMVNQLPGFQLDDGSGDRGFSAASGNILINGRLPSAKEDSPSAILGRIPASQVAHIELIRGQMRGVDMRGQTVIANILLREDIPATVRWETAVRKNLDVDKLMMRGNISLSDQWHAVDFNSGLSVERSATGERGLEDRFDGGGLLTEKRVENSTEGGHKLGARLNASGWAGQTRLQLNSSIDHMTETEPFVSVRTPQSPVSAPRSERFNSEREELEFELGFNAERELGADLTGKGILLFIRGDEDEVDTQTSMSATNVQTQFRQADAEAVSTEGIARLEFDWSGIENHALQLNVEGAYNELDGSLLQVVDRGLGAVVVDVPGANSVVEEVRGDFLLKDTWSLGKFELDYGLGAESSTISQRGDTVLERDFFFVKPHVVLSHAPGESRQTRLRLAREVAQLDFEDFISATVYEDDDLALGNPNLRPDTTWVAELGHERRYGELGVVKVTLFHHWIRDVLDLLPLSDSFEAPGNIGDGRRWGVELENTVSLEWLGLTGARLDMKLRWQDSSVTDPVTGERRMLSGNSGFGGTPYIDFRDENEYAFIADYRQDLEQARVAWGVNLGMRAQRPLYKVNELDVYDEGISVNAFVETTRWFGLKLRFLAENIPNLSQRRDRTSYAGIRNLSAVDFREISVGREGVRLTFLTSGSF